MPNKEIILFCPLIYQYYLQHKFEFKQVYFLSAC